MKFQKKKEKTPNRIPFSVFLASRVGMRYLPIKRIGNCAQLRMDKWFKAYQKKVVWARKDIVSSQCPKSVVSAQSKTFLEYFRLWKQFGGGFPWWLDAKTADALLILEKEWRAEEQNGKTSKINS